MKTNVLLYVGKAKYLTLPFHYHVKYENELKEAIDKKAIKRLLVDFKFFN